MRRTFKLMRLSSTRRMLGGVSTGSGIVAWRGSVDGGLLACACSCSGAGLVGSSVAGVPGRSDVEMTVTVSVLVMMGCCISIIGSVFGLSGSAPGWAGGRSLVVCGVGSDSDAPAGWAVFLRAWSCRVRQRDRVVASFRGSILPGVSGREAHQGRGNRTART